MGKYYDEETMGEVRAEFERHAMGWADVTTRKMFGCPAYRAQGHLFAVILTGSLVLTELPPEVRSTLPPELGATAFSAGTRMVPKWAQFPVTYPADLEPLLALAELSHQVALAAEG